MTRQIPLPAVWEGHSEWSGAECGEATEKLQAKDS